MGYFKNITSLADLKKQLRKLAMEHHPDRGGDTAVMQKINIEFEKLYDHWKNDTTASHSATGYESDYTGATAKQYTSYVYNEYRFTGSNYKGQSPPEVADIIRKWLKTSYPRCKFSVTVRDYRSIYVYLVKADFEPFVNMNVRTCQLHSVESISKHENLTDRAKEVMSNVLSFADSYNFDDSDIMTDYHHVNYYLRVGIGNHTTPFKYEPPKLKAPKGSEPPEFNHPEGETHKIIKRALKKARFNFYDSQRHGRILVLGEDHYYRDDQSSFYPLSYSSRKTAQKRIEKLDAAGILSKLTGYDGGYIQFLGYKPETEAAMEMERQELVAALKKWRKEHNIAV